MNAMEVFVGPYCRKLQKDCRLGIPHGTASARGIGASQPAPRDSLLKLPPGRGAWGADFKDIL